MTLTERHVTLSDRESTEYSCLIVEAKCGVPKSPSQVGPPIQTFCARRYVAFGNIYELNKSRVEVLLEVAEALRGMLEAERLTNA